LVHLRFLRARTAYSARGAPLTTFRVVSSQPKPIIAGECGVSLLAHGYYRRLREPVDTLVVVCGPTSKDTRDSRFSHWLQKTAGRARRMASVCVAAFILAEAGLLHNKRATTHWAFAADLQKKYPDVKVDANPIWIQDGNIYTSAGITAGIDLALAMVERGTTVRPWHGCSAQPYRVFCADLAVRRNSAFPYQRKLRDVRRYMTFRCGWQKT